MNRSVQTNLHDKQTIIDDSKTGINIDLEIDDDLNGGELSSIDIIKYVGLTTKPIKITSVDKKYNFEINTTRNNKKTSDGFNYKFKGTYTGVYLINYIGNEDDVPVNNFGYNSEGLLLKIFEDDFDKYHEKYLQVKNDPDISNNILEIYFYGKIKVKNNTNDEFNNLIYQITRFYNYNHILNDFNKKMTYFKNTIIFLDKLNSKKIIFNDFKEANIRPTESLDVVIIDYNSQTLSKFIEGPQTFMPLLISKISKLVSPYHYIFNSSVFYSLGLIDFIICLFINMDVITFLNKYSNIELIRDTNYKFGPFNFDKLKNQQLYHDLYLIILDPLMYLISANPLEMEQAKGLINEYNPYTFDEILKIINSINMDVLVKTFESYIHNRTKLEARFQKKINNIKLFQLFNFNIKSQGGLFTENQYTPILTKIINFN